MADSIAVLSPVDRVTSAGASVSGAKINFYVAGTATPLVVYSDHELTSALGATVYCDSDGFPVTADGGTTKTAIYTGTADYKVIITDADDVTIVTLDNLKGAIDTSAFSGGGEVEQVVPVVAKSASYTIVVGDNGKLFDFTTTGGDCTGTLPSAIDVGDGFYVGLRHNGTANELIIETVSSQTIRHLGAATDALALTGRGETIWLASDGANWVAYGYVPPLISAKVILTIADRLSAPPVSPAAGARYILTSSPSGAWSSFAEHDIVESDGSSSWIKRTPPSDCGWLAYVQDEDTTYQFRGSAWVSFATVSDTVPSLVARATAAQMEAATATDVFPPPSLLHRHPGVAKFWAVITVSGGTPTLQTSYNVTGITDTATGRVAVTIDTDFSSANWCPSVEVLGGVGSAIRSNVYVETIAAGSIQVAQTNSGPNYVDPDAWFISGFGDQA